MGQVPRSVHEGLFWWTCERSGKLPLLETIDVRTDPQPPAIQAHSVSRTARERSAELQDCEAGCFDELPQAAEVPRFQYLRLRISEQEVFDFCSSSDQRR